MELEIETTEREARQTIAVVADNVVKLFTKKIEMAAVRFKTTSGLHLDCPPSQKPFDLYASTCDSLRSRLDRVEGRKCSSDLTVSCRHRDSSPLLSRVSCKLCRPKSRPFGQWPRIFGMNRTSPRKKSCAVLCICRIRPISKYVSGMDFA